MRAVRNLRAADEGASEAALVARNSKTAGGLAAAGVLQNGINSLQSYSRTHSARRRGGVCCFGVASRCNEVGGRGQKKKNLTLKRSSTLSNFCCRSSLAFNDSSIDGILLKCC